MYRILPILQILFATIIKNQILTKYAHSRGGSKELNGLYYLSLVLFLQIGIVNSTQARGINNKKVVATNGQQTSVSSTLSEVVINVNWPAYSGENKVDVYDPGDNLIQSICVPAHCYTGGNNTPYTASINLGCLTNGAGYYIVLYDSANDGWDGRSSLVEVFSGGVSVLMDGGSSAGTGGTTLSFLVSGGGVSVPVASIFAIQPSCTDGVAQSNGYLQISSYSYGDRYNFSIGSSYTGDPDYANALVIGSLPFQFNNGLTNPSGTQDYTVRIFSDCGTFTDYTVTMNEQDCIIGCNCSDYIYLNDIDRDIIHKFKVNETNGALTEIGSPWNDSGINLPHGVAIDNNGFLYIAEINNNYTASTIHKLTCDGEIVDDNWLTLPYAVYNLIGTGDVLYTNGDAYNGQYKIEAYDLCTGTLIGCQYQNSGWGFSPSYDGQSYFNTQGWDGPDVSKVWSGPLDRSQYSTDDCPNPSAPGPSIELVSSVGSTANNATPMGVTQDDEGNIYVVITEGNGDDAPSYIRKFNSTGSLLVTSTTDSDLADNIGWSGARGIVFSDKSGYIYVASRDDCISVFDKDLNYLSSLAVPYEVGAVPKALGILTECCPTNNNITIDTTLCGVSINDQISLQSLVNCSGTVCEGFWMEGGSNTGLSYNSCDNSVRITAANACGTFTLTSDGASNNPQCGAFTIRVNITVNSLVLNVTETNCTDNGDGTFTAAYNAEVNWNSEPCVAGERIHVSHNGSLLGTIDPSSDSSPSTFPFSLSADGIGTHAIKAEFTIATCADSTSFTTPLPCPVDTSPCTSTISAPVIATDQSICNGEDPATFTVTTTATGSGTLTYQWQSSTTDCAAGFTDIESATSATYAPPAITATTYYRVVVTNTISSLTCTATSNCLTITVNSLPTATPISTQGTCTGATVNNDATINLNAIMNADIVGIVAGTDYISGVAYNADASTNAALYDATGGNVTFTGLIHNTSYTIRVFNGSTCFTDIFIAPITSPSCCSTQDCVTIQGSISTTNSSVGIPSTLVICDNASNYAELTAITGLTNVLWFNSSDVQVGIGDTLRIHSSRSDLADGIETFYYTANYDSGCEVIVCAPFAIQTENCCAAISTANDTLRSCPGLLVLEGNVSFNDGCVGNCVYKIVSQPTNGTLAFQNSGFFEYSPANLICGNDVFTYELCDTITTCCTVATVTVLIEDTIIPILQNIPVDDTISCDELLIQPPLVIAQDNCLSISMDVREESTQGEAGCSLYDYTLTRTWTAIDGCDNSTSDRQVVEIQDVTAPDIFRVYTLPNGKKMIAGVMENVNENWKTISLPIEFPTKPLIFSQVISTTESTPVTTRIRNVSTSQFELKLQEEEGMDDQHIRESVAWMAIEEGTQTIDFSLEAQRLSLTGVWETITFNAAYPVFPSLFGQLQTMNDSDPAALRIRTPMLNSVQVQIEEEASINNDVTHSSEEVAFLGIEHGINLTNEEGAIFGETGSVSVDEQWISVPTQNQYYNPVVLAGIPRHNGVDAGIARIRNVSANGFDIRFEEWDYLDGLHMFESISYVVIEGSLPLDASIICQAGTDGLELGKDIIALDNCDVNVNLEYSEHETTSGPTTYIHRNWASTDACGNSTVLSQIIECQGVALRLKAYLQGALLGNDGSNLMRDDLRKKNLLPLEEPYSKLPSFTHLGGSGGVRVDPSLFQIEGENGIVDWVFIELRDKHNVNEVVATTAALIQRDGEVVDINGKDTLQFGNVLNDDYYVSIRHRNHLGLVTLNTYNFSPTNIPFVDFTYQFEPIAGNVPTVDEKEQQALWSGDLNFDEKVIYQGPNNDIFSMFLEVLLDEGNTNFLPNFINKGYTEKDFNLDGKVIYQGPNNDRSLLLFNTILKHPQNDLKFSNFVIQVYTGN